MNDFEVTAGIDIGGTNTTVGIVDRSGRILATDTFPTDTHLSADHFVARIAMIIEDHCKKLPSGSQLRGIGVASPAANYRDGTIERAANLMWGTINIVRMLKEYFDLPVAILNDSNASALGEMYYGVAKGMKNFVVITLGTGLGAGIVLQGHLLQGETGSAGELGHITVDPAGRECGCGRRGCAETYVSATGLRRTAVELLAQRTTRSNLRALSPDALTSKRIFELAATGDLLAQAAFDITGAHLGRLLANVAAIFDPQAIILSGGLANAGELLLRPACKTFDETVLDIHRGKVRILLTEFANGASAVLGASHVCRSAAMQNVLQ